MSKNTSASGGKIVALPSFPKFADGALRSQWVKEYDRVEAELLKHHLAVDREAADTSGSGGHHGGSSGRRHSNDNAGTNKNNNADADGDENRSTTNVISLRHIPNWSREAPTEIPQDPKSMRKKKDSDHHGFTSHAARRAQAKAAAEQQEQENNSPFSRKKKTQQQQDEYQDASSISRTAAVGTLDDDSNSLGRSRGGGTNSPARANAANPFDLNRWSRVLDAIIHPPIQFRGSLNVLGSEGWELKWMQNIGRTDRVPSLHTLETLRDSVYDHPKDIALNSPRSILVMLKNGLAVSDLRPRTRHSFDHNDLPPKEQNIAFQHYEQRRKGLISSLKSEYRQMCQHITLHDLIDAAVGIRESRSFKLSHNQDAPPARMQPWSMSGARVSPRQSPSRSDTYRNNSPNRAATATPTSGGGKHLTFSSDNINNNNTTAPRSNSAMGFYDTNKSSSVRGFDLDSQFRRGELQKQREAEIIEKKRQQEDHARIVSLRRQLTFQKIQEVAETTRIKAEERQQKLDAHVLEVEKNRAEVIKKAKEREMKRSEHRQQICVQAKEREVERRQKIITKIRREDEALAKTKASKESSLKFENALRHQQLADRSFLGLRHKRASEFKKLFTVADIYDKNDRAENASVRRRFGSRSPSPPDEYN